MNILKRYLLSGALRQMPESGGGSSATPSSAPSPGSSGGSSPTPSSAAPTPSPSPGSAAPSGGSSVSSSAEPSPTSEEVVDFSMIFGDGPEPSEVPSPPPAAAPQAPPAAAQPIGTPQAPAPAATQPQVSGVPGASAAPALTEAPSAPPVAQLDPYDPAALASALSGSEVQAIQHVSDTVFKLSAEEIEALETDTVAAVPKLLAKTLVRAQQNMLQTLGRLLPTMIQRQTAVMKRRMESEQSFYSRWPDLKPDKHGDLVMQYAQVFRQLNPEVPTEQMIEQVGAMVMMAAKVTPSGHPAPQAMVPSSPMVPARFGPQPSPFTPAGPVGGGPTTSQPIELHPVEVMFDPNQG